MHASTLKTCNETEERFYTSRGEPVSKPKHAPVHKRLSVYAVIRDQMGNVLFVRKGQDAPWELPGGKIEGAESYEKALVRECLEETGFHIRTDKPFEEYPHGQGLLAGSDGKFYNSFQHFYQAHIVAGQPDSDTSEMADVKWINPKDLGEATCKMIFQPILRILCDNY